MRLPCVFKIDGVNATLNTKDECVVWHADEEIPADEQPSVYAAACLFISSRLVLYASSVHQESDMGDEFFEHAYIMLEARWIDYIVDRHAEDDSLPTLTREEAEERLDAMRNRMTHLTFFPSEVAARSVR
ncbi:MAG: hypothetical protein IKZ87_01685 [Actinomycetaceae bacterium]|nr:hypothetical protein [Actinomycetaceae bacterium]